jgi:hypothetical protein
MDTTSSDISSNFQATTFLSNKKMVDVGTKMEDSLLVHYFPGLKKFDNFPDCRNWASSKFLEEFL